jgi:hypothetical protein
MPILSYAPPADEALAFPPAPAYLQPLLFAWLGPLLGWLTQHLYHLIVARCPTHPLVRLAAAYDPAAVVQVCAAYHHTSGPGAPPTYTVAQLVRAEMVRVWAGSCSDPALERLLLTDLVARWFVGLPLLGPTPDHATLHRFHAWLTRHQPAALFADVLAFLDRVDPEDPAATPQIADTFALASPAAPHGVVRVLLDLARQLVAAWQQHAPPAQQAVLATLDLTLLAQPPPLYTADQRAAALSPVVALVRTLEATLRPHLPTLPLAARAATQHWLDLLGKVLTDETITDAAGAVTERPVGQKGAYRLASAVDVEATFRKHAPDPAVFGYNAALATTKTRIRAAVNLPGSTPDSAAPVALLEQQQAAGQPLPPQVIMDAAAGWGKTRAEVEVVSGGQTQVVARIPQSGGADPTRFSPADFVLSADGGSCTCPNGVVSRKAYASGEGDGVHFRFTAKQCADCPLTAHCRAPASAPMSHRTVYITPYHEHLRAAAAFNGSDAGKALLADRWRVEPTIAWLVRYDGCRRARQVGLAAAQCHLYQACALRNLWRWLGRVARRTSPARRGGGVAAAA